jgi:MerR family transcriptional regulator, copper efflux regulator
MRISLAADLVGVPAHVLRHWEDEGVLAPSRQNGNQRDFTDQHVNEARIIHRLRQAGIGLAEIRELRSAPAGHRSARLTASAERMAAEANRLDAAATFLRHTAECVHPVVDECRQCRDYAIAEEATSPRPTRSGRGNP